MRRRLKSAGKIAEMTVMTKIGAFGILAALILSGCNSALQNFVGGRAPAAVSPAATPLPFAGADLPGIKMSPGSSQMAGATLGAEMTLTPTRGVYKGARLGAQIAINRTQMAP